MRTHLRYPLLLAAWLCGCGANADSAATSPRPPSARPPAVPALPADAVAPFEVHEWGLVRGGYNDVIVVGGSMPEMMAMAVAKPILYFHLGTNEPLQVDVTARMGPGGTIAESWPIAAAANAPSAHWSARVTHGSCHHGRLPSLNEPPCLNLVDGCESATLATVESDDADCVTVGLQSANHLFYRGTLVGVDPLPLVVELQPNGTIRVRNRSTEVIPGVLLRVRLAGGQARVTDAAIRATPPAPGASVDIPVPTGTTVAAAAEVSTMLGGLGLTAGETAAFRRAWDMSLFRLDQGAMADQPIWLPNAPYPVHAGAVPAVTAAPMATLTAPRTTESLVYFLPPAAVEQLATLEITPRPTHIRRAIAVWLQLPTP